ncbi:MAG: hypothetical protein QOG77_3698 [Solirubrobacteraceae bacterium]|nr:hypothetical protein [Solirubrobacteraceae bacterium]
MLGSCPASAGKQWVTLRISPQGAVHVSLSGAARRGRRPAASPLRAQRCTPSTERGVVPEPRHVPTARSRCSATAPSWSPSPGRPTRSPTLPGRSRWSAWRPRCGRWRAPIGRRDQRHEQRGDARQHRSGRSCRGRRCSPLPRGRSRRLTAHDVSPRGLVGEEVAVARLQNDARVAEDAATVLAGLFVRPRLVRQTEHLLLGTETLEEEFEALLPGKAGEDGTQAASRGGAVEVARLRRSRAITGAT